MPRTFAANSTADPQAAWSLIAEPERWHEWAPHVRGAWGLGAPEVGMNKIGVARLLGVIPVPAQIVQKRPGRSWTWRVGPLILVHSVVPRDGGGCRIAITIQAPGQLEGLVGMTYGPVVQLLVDNLARVAARTS